MQRFPFSGIVVHVDVGQTRELYRGLKAPDPGCCNACRTFLEAVNSRVLPGDLIAFLSNIGARVEAPVQTWGAPDSGFLQIWWPFVGRAPNPAEPDHAVQIGNGMSLALTTHFPRPSFIPSDDLDIPALELTWSAPEVKSLELQAATRG